jgi:predicted KAP-like P-loop ATPase
MKSEIVKALEQSLDEYIIKSKKDKDKIQKLSDEKYKLSIENYELKKKIKLLEIDFENMFERIEELEGM